VRSPNCPRLCAGGYFCEHVVNLRQQFKRSGKQLVVAAVDRVKVSPAVVISLRAVFPAVRDRHN